MFCLGCGIFMDVQTSSTSVYALTSQNIFYFLRYSQSFPLIAEVYLVGFINVWRVFAPRVPTCSTFVSMFCFDLKDFYDWSYFINVIL